MDYDVLGDEGGQFEARLVRNEDEVVLARSALFSKPEPTPPSVTG